MRNGHGSLPSVSIPQTDRHFQHVAAPPRLASSLLQSVLSRRGVSDFVKIRLRCCAAYGSGAWHSISCIGDDTALDDDAYVHSILRRLGHPMLQPPFSLHDLLNFPCCNRRKPSNGERLH